MWDGPDALARASDPAESPTWLGAAAMRSLPLALAVAANPATTPRILGTIAARWKEARAVVCRHPRTRRRLLMLLAREHPDAFLANPRAEQLVRATDRAVPIAALRALVAREAPAWLRDAIATHPFADVRAVLDPPAAPPPPAPPPPRPTRADFEHLARSGEVKDRQSAASAYDLPPDLVLLLARDPDRSVRWRIAYVHGDAAVIEILARDEDAGVRRQLVENRRRRGDVAFVERFARDPDVAVREQVALCAGLATALLVELSADPFVEVRIRVAMNEGAPPDVLARLAADPAADGNLARWALIHPRVPFAAVTAGLRGPRKDVARRVLRERIDRPETAADVFASLCRPDIGADEVVASCTHLPSSVARQIAHQGTYAARLALAKTTGEREIHRILAADSERTVRAALAARGILHELLASDGAPEVRLVVARHTSDPALAERYARAIVDFRKAVAANPNAPAHVHRALADDPEPDVRFALIYNPAAPLDALLRLRRRPDEQGRRARDRLRELGHAAGG